MLRNLFHRHEDSHTLLQSTDATTSSAAQAQDWAALGTIAVPGFGPAAQRYVTPAGALSPVARKAVERITGSPIA